MQLSKQTSAEPGGDVGSLESNDKVKKLKCKVTARNRRNQVIFVSELSCGRHEEIHP